MSPSPRINCPICGKRLLGERNLRMHTQDMHPAPGATKAAQPSQQDAGHPYGLEHPEQAP